MKTNNVSVVIPAYNEVDYIEACLDALILQIKPGDEIIVVDNNSSDKTADLVAKYKQATLVSQPRKGRTYAQALGFEEAKNDILVRIDADTIVKPNWLDKIRSTMSIDGIDAVTGPGESYDLVLKLLPSFFMGFFTFTTNRIIAGHYPIWGSNCALRRSAWDKIKHDMQDRLDIWEDFEMGILFKRYRLTVYYQPDLVVEYSNRSVVNNKIVSTITYQMRASKTYYVHQQYLTSILSAFERLIMMISVSPLFLVERTLQFLVKKGRFYRGRRATLVAMLPNPKIVSSRRSSS